MIIFSTTLETTKSKILFRNRIIITKISYLTVDGMNAGRENVQKEARGVDCKHCRD